jgi:hypothetical protein
MPLRARVHCQALGMPGRGVDWRPSRTGCGKRLRHGVFCWTLGHGIILVHYS